MFFHMPITGDQQICDVNAPWCFIQNTAKSPSEYNLQKKT